MKKNLGNRIRYGNTSLQAENLETHSGKNYWDTAHFQSTRDSFPLGSLVGPRSCAGLVLMQLVLAGQRGPQELAEGINLAMGFQRLKGFEADLPMPSPQCRRATSNLHDYLLLLQDLPEQ